MLTDLLPRPIAWILGGAQEPQVKKTIEPLQQTPPDSQVLEPSSEMARKPPNDHTRTSGDNSRSARNPEHGRHEGRPQAASSTTAQRYGRDRSRSRLREHSHKLAEEHEALVGSHRKLSEAHRAVETSLSETQIMCKNQQQVIDTLKEKLRSASVLLETRNQELKVAKTFLSKEDPFSTFDVVQSVRDLNSEIMQTAAHLAENLPLKRIRAPPAVYIPEGPCKSIFVSLVSPQGSGEEVDAGLLELALQGSLAVYMHWIANAWGFHQASGWCDEIYSKVCETEHRTVASNWRALTRRTLFNIDSSQQDLPHLVVNSLIEQLAGLLSSCGVGEPADNTDNIRKYAADKLGSLFTAARKLNKMIGENVVSDDLMVIVIGEGHLFDGEHMEDAYARGGVKPNQRVVICTTDLGLCERKRAGGEKILLKSKVVLRDN